MERAELLALAERARAAHKPCRIRCCTATGCLSAGATEVLVHVGFAISTVDEMEAQRVFAYLREMDELAELSEVDDALH